MENFIFCAVGVPKIDKKEAYNTQKTIAFQ